MNLVFASSKEYIKYAKVLLFSLFESHSDESYDIYIMHYDDMGDTLEKLSDWMADYCAKCHPIRVSDEIYNMAKDCLSDSNTPFHPANTYRFACIELLPETVDRVLMIGLDTIVKQSIREFYYMDIPADKWFVLCEHIDVFYGKDRYSNAALKAREAQRFGIDFFTQYINSDVCLINLKHCRQGFTYKDFTQFIQNNKLALIDQDALAYKYADKILRADGFRYNYLVNKDIPDKRYNNIDACKIIHYVSKANKPWFYQDTTWYNRLWWNYAKRCLDTESYHQLESGLKAHYSESFIDSLTRQTDTYFKLMVKYQLYYEFFTKFEEKRLAQDFHFSLCENKKIALYGLGTIGKILYKELTSAGYTVTCVIDQHKKCIDTVETVLPQNIAPDIDLIIITPVYDYFAIRNNLMQHTTAQIISAFDVL